MSVSAVFNETYYLQNNEDVVLALAQKHFTSALQHFEAFGAAELRDPNVAFNSSYYASQNPDVLNAVAQGVFSSVFAHFQSFGETESRAPSVAYAGFDSAAYLTANTDVAAAVTAGSFTSALDHYITFGAAESRAGSGIAENPTTVGGVTLALTTNTDALVGGENADIFSGLVQGAGVTGTTAQPADTITGGAGTDTLNISVAGDSGTAAFTLSAVSTDGVERVFVSNFETDAAQGGNQNDETIIATGLMSGLTTVGTSSSGLDGATTFNGMTNFVAAEMDNGSQNLTLTYDGSQVVTGTADSQALAVSNMSAGTFTANGIETIAITTDTVKSTLAAVASDALKTVTIAGDQALKITAALDFAANGTKAAPGAVIDASANSGGVTIVTTASEVLEITGSSGDDSITAGSLTANDTIDGGAGADTLTMAAAALTTQLADVSNVETFKFSASTAATTMDVSKLSDGITSIEMDVSDGSDNTTVQANTITNLASQTVTLKHSANDASTSGDADGVSHTITGATDTTSDSVAVIANAISTPALRLGIDALDVGNYETVNLTSTASTSVTANEITDLTATSATTINLDGDADLTTTIGGGALTTLNASGMTGALTGTLSADKVAVTLGSKSSTVNFGTSMDNNDSVTGGAGTADTVTATMTGKTATTGALTISAVENINMTTSGNNTFNLAGVTGTGTFAVTDNVQTITGFDLGQTISLGLVGDASATSAEIDVTAADATGTNDTLNVAVENTVGATTAIIDASSIENLALTVNSTNAANLDLTTFEGTGVTLGVKSGVTATGAVDLANTHKNTTSVVSTYAAAVTVDMSNNTSGVAYTGVGSGVQTVTGTSKADTVTIGSTGGVVHVISGGAGTDTVNLTGKAGLADVGSIDVETINLDVAAGNDITITTSFGTGVDNVNVTGGNALSTLTTGTIVNEVKTVNAGSFAGNIKTTIADDQLDTTVVITGGALTSDEVSVTTANAATTYALSSTGVEILRVDSNAAAATTVSVAAATGLATVEVDMGANTAAQTFTVSNLAGTETLVLKATDNATANHTLVASLADNTGASDTIKFQMGTGTIDAGGKLQAVDIETVTVDAANAANIDLSGLSMATAGQVMNLTVTGDSQLDVSAINADVTTIDASGMSTGGSFIQAGRSGTAATTYTGSTGGDTFIMSASGDTITGGTGTDTLDVNKSAILGGLNIDLTNTTDQIVSFNGSATSGTVTGFENVDVSGFTGTFGSQITASASGSAITGTARTDQITLGAKGDTITFGAFSTNDVDTISGFSVNGTGNVDVLELSGVDANFAATVKVGTLANAAAGVVNVQGTAGAADIDVLILLDTAGFASSAAAIDEYAATAGDVTDTDGLVVLYFDNAASNLKLAYDANEATDGGAADLITIATFDDLGSADLANFAAANFS
jgi:hypothetical protein